MFKSIKELIEAKALKVGAKKGLDEVKIAAALEAAKKDGIVAPSADFFTFNKGVLTVRTKSAAASQDIVLRRPEIAAYLKKAAGVEISDIKTTF